MAQPNLADWHGRDLIDNTGEKIGKLEDVYVDVETDEPMFGTVKEGFIGRQADESRLYHHYELNYTAPATESGRRLARR